MKNSYNKYDFRNSIKAVIFVGVVGLITQYIKDTRVGGRFNLGAYILIFLAVTLTLGLMLLIIHKLIRKIKSH